MYWKKICFYFIYFKSSTFVKKKVVRESFKNDLCVKSSDRVNHPSMDSLKSVKPMFSDPLNFGSKDLKRNDDCFISCDLDVQNKSKFVQSFLTNANPVMNESGDLKEFEMLEHYTNNLSLSPFDKKYNKLEDYEAFVKTNSNECKNKFKLPR